VRGLRRKVRQFLAEHSKLSLVTFFLGGSIVSFVILTAIFASIISPYSPNRIVGPQLAPPSSQFIMGTDILGRDVLSRVLWGGRASLTVAIIATLLSMGIGSPFGALSGYFGGKLDTALTSVMDTLYCFPCYILALLIAVILGPEATNISVAVGISYIPEYFRVVRSIALNIKEKTFIEAEKVLGASHSRIVFIHIMPYTLSSISVMVSMGVADSILAVAGLGFLGLGVRPPTPEWGTDMRWGRGVFLTGSWWVSLFPGIFVFLSVLGFNLLSEGINSILKERGAETFVT